MPDIGRKAPYVSWPLVAIVAACLAGVFVVPWFVPTGVEVIVSDSQAVGFANGAAMLALAAGCAALFLRGRRQEGTRAGFLQAAGDGSRLSPWLVAAAAVLVLIAVGAAVLVFRDRAFGEASYFVQRTLLLINGDIPYRDFEFTYGPLLLYPEYWLWMLLRPLFVSAQTAYVSWFALARVGGVLLLAFILDRVSMSRRLRDGVFVSVMLFELLQIGFGLNYTLLRFTIAGALLLAVSGLLSSGRGLVLQAAFAALAAALTFLVSPEMGIALIAGIVAAYVVMALRHGGPYRWLAAGAVFAAGCVPLLGALFPTFRSFASGAFYLPVLPGPPQLLYIAGLLTLALATGRGRGLPAVADARQTGWFVTCVVLAAAALGRADFGHVFWNGLGVFLVVPAIIQATRPKLAAAFTLGVAVTFVGLLVAYQVTVLGGLPSVLSKVGGLSGRLAATGGVPPNAGGPSAPVLAGGAGEGETALTPRADSTSLSVEQARTLDALGPIAITTLKGGGGGGYLAERRRLAPTFAWAPGSVDWGGFEREIGALQKAEWLLLPADEYRLYAREGVPADAGRPLMVPAGSPVASAGMYGALLGVPVALVSRQPQFDPSRAYAAYITANWTQDRVLGGLVLLRRR
jgi:hypothetical protein